jgi:3-hydroxyisobutyrate dehydrogenase
MKVGFIGLGSMGYGQAMLLAKSSHDVTVFDVFPKAMEPFKGVATLAATAGDVGKDADAVGICVRDEKQVRECLDALLPVMKEGSALMIHSTVHPDTMKELASRCADHKINILDAAVTRTVIAQDAPFVFCMLGGDEAVANSVQSILDAYSTDTIFVGAHGSAMAMKIANNLVSWSQIMIGLEAFKMAEAAGVPTDKLLQVMKKNGVLTPPMGGFIQLRATATSPETSELITSQSGIGEKDLSLAEAVGKSAGSPTPIASYIRGMIRRTLDAMAGK